MTQKTLDLRKKEEMTFVSHKEGGMFGVVRSFAAFVLVVFFLIQPVATVFGSEENTLSETVPVITEPIVTEPAQPTLEDILGEEITPPAVESSEATTSVPDSPDTAIPPAEDIPSEVATDTATNTPVLNNEEVPQGDATGTPITTSTSTEAIPPTATTSDTDVIVIPEVVPTTTPEIVATTTPDTLASTTDEVPVVPIINTVTNDDNRYQFSTHECISVGGGSFYCTESQSTTTTLTLKQKDGVVALPDSQGDLEIYAVVEGVMHQLTNNELDDAAPYYDEFSNRIVFHRLIDDRYQIVSLDLKSGEETQLTHTSYNNMEPTAYNDVVVWQSWIHNNWEVMLFSNGEIKQLTENEVHDIAPRINKDYIVWQSQVDDTWYVNVLNKETGTIEKIVNKDNALIENPRFVLVYDARMDNGDVETIGYDLETGKIVPLSSSPRPVPTDIPKPDQTGEERALIQSKPKIEENNPVDEPVSSGDNGEVPPLTVSTSTATGTQQVSIDASSTPARSEVVVPDIEPLVIPPFIAEE